MGSRERDRKMMTNVKAWPRFPYLPLIRQAGERKEVGLLFYDFSDKDVKPIVLLANLCLPEDEKKLCDKLPYQSFDDILDAGWRVD